MRDITRRRGTRLLAGFAAIAVVGSAVAVGGSSAADNPSSERGPVTQADAAVREALGAFRRAPQQGDFVPVGVRGALAGSQGVADVNPDLGRAVGPGGRLYLMPGDGQLCVGRDLDPGSVLYCTADAALQQGRFVGAVVHTADGLEVSGIVGDGASAARVTTTRGTIDADVVDGAVLTTVDAPPLSIAWVDRAGDRHAETIGAGRSTAVPAGARPAQGPATLKRVYRDCARDGRLDGRYDRGLLRRALREMPSDLADYSRCPKEIRAALRRTRK